MGRRALVIGVLAALALAEAAGANAPDCEGLAEAAAARHGIPEGVMAAIARTESGGGPRASAWPWTLNMGGEGMYLESAGAALARLRAVLDEGRSNVDVGCMQVNWRWHGEAFDSLEQMIDPAANTEYAARFLVDLWRREGTWEAAVQAYHSSDPERGAAYLARVERNRPMGGGALVAAHVPEAVARPQAVAGDRRFGAQAPLVAVAASSRSPVGEGGGASVLSQGGAGLPEGRLPDLSRGAVAGPVPGFAQDSRLSRLRAGFGSDIPPDAEP